MVIAFRVMHPTGNSVDLQRLMANKTDEELYDVLYGHAEDYASDATEVAKQEFDSRKLTAATLTGLGIAVGQQKRVEQARLEWPLRMVAFFISTMFLGIPVILAHRHYVEKGARRKALDWARWGLFGFLFYLGVSILGFILPLASK